MRDEISASLDEIIEKYGKYVFGIVRYFLYGQPRETHEELYQEIWLKVCRKISDFENRSKISTYLYAIARNTIFTFLEKSRRERTVSIEELNFEPGSGERDVALSLTLKSVIDGLDEEDRNLLTLKYTLDMSCREIGAELSLTEENVKQRLLRIRRKMRESLGDCF